MTNDSSILLAITDVKNLRRCFSGILRKDSNSSSEDLPYRTYNAASTESVATTRLHGFSQPQKTNKILIHIYFPTEHQSIRHIKPSDLGSSISLVTSELRLLSIIYEAHLLLNQ